MSTSTVKVNSVPVSEAAPFPVILQSFLLTDPSRENSRLRVDVGQTSFFAGREFRSFKEFNLTTGANYVIKAVVPLDVILFELSFTLTSGEVKLYTKTGGTEDGSFSETLPIIPRNSMSERPTPFYTPQTVLTAGGTHSGGTTLDLIWSKVSDNSNKASNSDASIGAERGIAAGTYYFIAQAVSAATGVIHARWEERG